MISRKNTIIRCKLWRSCDVRHIYDVKGFESGINVLVGFSAMTESENGQSQQLPGNVGSKH